MRLECKHVWRYLSDYIDASVSAEERAAIEEHLAHCEVCSAILDSVHNILVLSADDRVFNLPIGFGERLHARIHAELGKASLPEQDPDAGASANVDGGSADG